jgi:hypothetical protein
MIKVAADGTFNRANLRIEIERFERPLADLRRLRDGGHPATEEIRTAPRIDRCRFAGRQVTCPSGAAYGRQRPGLPYIVPTITINGPSTRHRNTPVRSRASTASENLRLRHRPAATSFCWSSDGQSR